MEVLASAIKQEKEIQGIYTGKGEIKMSLFTDNMIVYVENHKKSKTTTNKLLELTSKCSNLTEFKINKTKVHSILIYQ